MTGKVILKNSGAHVISKCPLSLSARGEYYLSSTTTVRCFLEKVCEYVIGKYYCSEEIFSEQSIHDATVSISSNGYLLQSMHQCLSDASNVQNRVARDSFFEGMVYDHLVSRHTTITEQEKISKKVQVETLKRKLHKTVRKTANAYCVWWRTGPLEKLRNHPSSGPRTSITYYRERIIGNSTPVPRSHGSGYIPLLPRLCTTSPESPV